MPRILIAIDKFKGCLSAVDAGAAVARGIRSVHADWPVDLCPIADGGEGTMQALCTALNGEEHPCETVDALGRPISANYALCGTDAVLEMSAASGLDLVKDLPRQPERASTYGTGLLLRAALQQPVQRVIIGIGGSATNDGGAGMAQALGFVFRDAQGQILQVLPEELDRLHSIEPPACQWPRLLVACDVTNPLLGPQGATQVYGPQKGVTDAVWFEQRLNRLADVAERSMGKICRDLPGAGAAGGLGWALICLCGAELVSGFDLVAQVTQLKQRMAQADLIITGEGSLDEQTLCGKGPAGVAQMARTLRRRCIAFAGRVTDHQQLLQHFDEVYAIQPQGWTVEQSMQKAAALLEQTVRKQLRLT